MKAKRIEGKECGQFATLGIGDDVPMKTPRECGAFEKFAEELIAGSVEDLILLVPRRRLRRCILANPL